MRHLTSAAEGERLKARIRSWARQLGFTATAFAPVTLPEVAVARLMAWLAAGCHGEMDYMARSAAQRAQPRSLIPEALCIITVRMDYWPRAADAQAVLADPTRAYVARYALGRDYHKLMRSRLKQLALTIEAHVGPFRWRPFSDSAPLMEVELARLAGLGWRGKHTLLLTREGSWFFLGELLTDLPLPPDAPTGAHCGTCTACMAACPTGAITAPYQLDARRCIAYLTIEHKGPIPLELRPLIGNRIYGCDDCQLFCPWNRHTRVSPEADFQPRHGLDAAQLIELFAWDEATFLDRFAGSAIRRIGHTRWLRNIAVALGNAPPSPTVVAALRARLDHPSALVREHVQWALERQLAQTDDPSARPS
ncbi:MAG: tRNA epoxyqueuosine(34) reductase QueG [Thiobacillaceae bacterium]|nr:tRNA epoxyqueuosine(34) reductase QueG [Thiobacillaceae bacterium]MCX7672345.1 tRNA epoxyqueuosine(34) reductase QueG [Thiobacillaceae bacterium]MDW8322473.1 tRNA epoxyqueuosine(34) reductase QueG [Burkholderiales bacterium]